MRTIVIKIDLDGAAFAADPRYEVSRVLSRYSTDVSRHNIAPRALFDSAGDRCGSVNLSEGDLRDIVFRNVSLYDINGHSIGSVDIDAIQR
jgi:hypothetical protein